MTPPRKILIIRTDRIGDVVLTLPMVSAIHKQTPKAEVWLMLRSYTAELAGFYNEVAGVLLADSGGTEKSFFELLKEIRSHQFDAAVFAYPRPRLALLMRLAKIPIRVGTGYRWYSFLFNNKIYEHRKTAEKHEAEYNLGLLKAIGFEVPTKVQPKFSVITSDKTDSLRLRKELGVAARKKLVVLHPGSGGSAKDWPQENFAALASSLIKSGFAVAVTGIASESGLARPIIETTRGKAVNATGKFSLTQLAAFVSTADAFVSNSTGPMHIAAAVGTPVVAFYPPVTVMSERRWGPLTNKKTVFIPDRTQCELCRGGECQGNVCMKQTTVGQVVDAVKTLSKKYSS